MDLETAYYDWLAPFSRQLQIWETVYFHELENHHRMIEFYSSTGLKPYLEGLPSEGVRDRFKPIWRKFIELFSQGERTAGSFFPFEGSS